MLVIDVACGRSSVHATTCAAVADPVRLPYSSLHCVSVPHSMLGIDVACGRGSVQATCAGPLATVITTLCEYINACSSMLGIYVACGRGSVHATFADEADPIRLPYSSLPV
jgi:hypothetical protein